MPDNHQQQLAGVAIRQFLHETDCSNNAELVTALTALMSRAAFVIEHRANTEVAMCALYEPYKVLCARKK
ncbi:MAG: hypothetical protein RPT11_02980 [Bermanella sp.]